MNYIHEMNLFKQWCRVNSPNTSEIVLWYALMAINNELGWVAHFKAPFVTLHPLTGLSERSIQSSRNKLRQAGLIQYEEGRKGKAGYYTVYEISKKVPNIFPNLFSSSSELLPYSSGVEMGRSPVGDDDSWPACRAISIRCLISCATVANVSSAMFFILSMLELRRFCPGGRHR